MRPLALATALALAPCASALAEDAPAAPTPSATEPAPAASTTATAAPEEERLLRALHSGAPGAAEAFHARCTPELAKLAPARQLAAIADGVGVVVDLLEVGRDGRDPSLRIYRLKGAHGAALVQIALDPAGRVAGLHYRPLADAPEPGSAPGNPAEGPSRGPGATIPSASTGTASTASAAPKRPARVNEAYVTKTRLTLPFDGKWTVGNGGRERATNNHVGNPNQDYAYDFIRGHKGEGKALTDYAAYGAEVLAPADGVVIQVVDGVPDVSIGETDPYIISGNMVVIDHKNGEYSFLCHFQRGSFLVRPGEIVLRGTALGLCGNSGNTSEPHIHFHLADDPVLHRGKALPAPFTDILVDGVKVKKVEPIRGRDVENAPEK